VPDAAAADGRTPSGSVAAPKLVRSDSFASAM